MPENLRNPEFEAEIEKNKHRDDYVKLGKESAEDFTKTFSLNWTYRNDFAKTLITLSAGMLALLASLSSTALLSAVPIWLLFLCMFSLFLTIFLNVMSLWIIIEVTRVAENFMEQEPEFAQKYEKMIQEHGRFEPKAIDNLFRMPFEKAWNSHIKAYNCLKGGAFLFVISLALLASVGLSPIPSSKPIASIQRSITNSPQSFGSHSSFTSLSSNRSKKDHLLRR